MGPRVPCASMYSITCPRAGLCTPFFQSSPTGQADEHYDSYYNVIYSFRIEREKPS